MTIYLLNILLNVLLSNFKDLLFSGIRIDSINKFPIISNLKKNLIKPTHLINKN